MKYHKNPCLFTSDLLNSADNKLEYFTLSGIFIYAGPLTYFYKRSSIDLKIFHTRLDMIFDDMKKRGDESSLSWINILH